MNATFEQLQARYREVSDLHAATALMGWDQTTYMPPGGGPSRGRQMATLSRIGHEKAIDPEIGRLLDALEPQVRSLPFESYEASFVRVARRKFDKLSKVPPGFTAELEAHSAASYQAWTEARPKDDFRALRPHLERTLEFSRRYADFFPGYEHIADPLIDRSDYGMKTSTIRVIFGKLRDRLVPLVEAITSQRETDVACLRVHYPEAEQLALGKEIITAFGFDFSRGRQDKSPHPFCTEFGSNDVRITTRVDEHDLARALFGTLHECGHALYELGVNPALEGTPMAGGTSSGVHESQSRLWENLVGRSRAFWEGWYPKAQERFPRQLGSVSLDTFYRAINKVERSLIRTEADEMTYDLHVITRFELELGLLEGTLSVADLPEAWRAAYAKNLGITPRDDRNGVMQDVHWYGGLIGGAFQGYTLGNLLSAQIFAKAKDAHPSVVDDMRRGDFTALRSWLVKNVHRHGSTFTAPELIERLTGGTVEVEPYIHYLREKFGALYALPS
jgi:carboxypeptidase Taq